ncbi:MAG TPA: cupin domain-containing protein [Gemmatimonadaceae bacterium]|nr:cupin domain-containing protein [Gemmatimonadaceae bacterium]
MQNVRQLGTAGIVAVALLTLATVASAQAKPAKATPSSSTAKSLTWGPAPDVFPAGAKMAVERGDPTKSGEFVVRLSFPAGYKIPPHWHPTAEHVHIRSGELLVGMGDAIDQGKAMKMAPGDTGSIGAKMHHFAIAPVPTVLSVRADGPFAMTYVNAADDPRKGKQ